MTELKIITMRKSWGWPILRLPKTQKLQPKFIKNLKNLTKLSYKNKH